MAPLLEPQATPSLDPPLVWSENNILKVEYLVIAQELVTTLFKTKVILSWFFFYQSFIECLLTVSVICWINSLSVKDRNSLDNIVKICSKITGVQLKSTTSLWNKRAVQKAKCIITHPNHVLSEDFTLMPSGRRYYSIRTRSTWLSNSCIPATIRLHTRLHIRLHKE